MTLSLPQRRPISRLKVWAERFFPALTRAFLSARILLDEHGQAMSVKLGRAVDKAGNPLASYTYPALEYLAEFDFTASLVFASGPLSKDTNASIPPSSYVSFQK